VGIANCDAALPTAAVAVTGAGLWLSMLLIYEFWKTNVENILDQEIGASYTTLSFQFLPPG
jgi:hypothetical protein